MGAVDTHQHLWDLNRVQYPWLTEDWGTLYGSHSPRDLHSQMEKAGVSGTILVQSANSYEDTDFLIDQANENPWILGIVGWVPLDDPDETGAMLEKYASHSCFKGIRYMVHAEPNPTWMYQDTVVRSLSILGSYDYSFDVVAVLPEHLMAVSVLSDKIPELNIVLDHLGSPPISTGEFDRWAGYISMVAENPRVYAKVSGLGTLSGNPNHWSDKDVQSYVDFAIDKFGVSRVMMGGDWPICNLAGGYIKTWNIYRSLISELSQIEQTMILELNARKFYKLGNAVVA